MRQLVSYDDIALYQEENGQDFNGTPDRSSCPPPSKKHKRSGQQPKRARQVTQHWDEPSVLNGTMDCDEENCDDAPGVVGIDAGTHGDESDEENGESRVLTVEEIWDDSALINAWNTATEEYEVFPVVLTPSLSFINNLFRLIMDQASGGKKNMSKSPPCAPPES
jgi:hypothetical protein